MAAQKMSSSVTMDKDRYQSPPTYEEDWDVHRSSVFDESEPEYPTDDIIHSSPPTTTSKPQHHPPIFFTKTSLTDPATFYEDHPSKDESQQQKPSTPPLPPDDSQDLSSLSNTSLAPSQNPLPEQRFIKLTLSTLLDTLYRDPRREARIQGLEDIVLIFAIPLFKIDGRLNQQWQSCEIVIWQNETEEVRPMRFCMQDPINGDKIFSFTRSPDRGRQRSFEEYDSVDVAGTDESERSYLKFKLRCVESGDTDEPDGGDGLYSIPADTPGLFTLRDGHLASGDKIYDIGIVLKVILNEQPSSNPILHYFDESSGAWTKRHCVKAGRKRLEYMCVLASSRRTRCVVQVGKQNFVRDPSGNDLEIQWPGTYSVKQSDGKVVEEVVVGYRLKPGVLAASEESSPAAMDVCTTAPALSFTICHSPPDQKSQTE